MNQLTDRLKQVYNDENSTVIDEDYCMTTLIVDEANSSTQLYMATVSVTASKVDQLISQLAPHKPGGIRPNWRAKQLDDVFTTPWLTFIREIFNIEVLIPHVKPAYIKGYNYSFEPNGSSRLVIIAEEALNHGC
jgi:hypothetical protein